MRLGRRAFLRAVAATLAAAAATATGVRRWAGARRLALDPTQADADAIALRLATVLPPSEDIVALGRVVLAGGGAMASGAVLAAEVVAAVPELAEAGDVGRGLRRAVRAEFGRGEFVEAGGWLLAPTEARAAALVALGAAG